MTSLVAALVSLLLGTSIFVAGNGLLSTTLALRTHDLGFSTAVTGFVMAAYFLGFLVGTYFCPGIVRRSGHVRAFSAFAAVAGAAILFHPLLTTPAAWALLRMITGICVVGLYMVIESWLNEKTSNEQRGRLFASYQVISLASLALGQYLILVDAGSMTTPFLLTGALFALGIVPLVLTRLPEPAPIAQVRLDLRRLWRISPVGVYGTLTTGLANGTFFALGPIFAQRVGMSTAEIAIFMSVVLLGGLALQWPIGHLSDAWDRRSVILGVGVAAAGLAALALAVIDGSMPFFAAVAFLYGGAAFTVYPLCVAHSNDHVASDDLVTTAGGLLLVYGIGAAVGPAVTGSLMALVGPRVFLAFIMASFVSLAAFVAFRMSVQAPPPLAEQEPFTMLSRTSQSAVGMLAAADEDADEDTIREHRDAL